MHIKAVAFDLDGTLYPACSLFVRCLDLALPHASLMYAFSAVRHRLHMLASSYMEPLETAMPTAVAAPPAADRGALVHMQAELVAQKLHIDTQAAFDRIEELFYRQVPERFAGMRPYKGALPALEALRHRGIPLAILSDLPPGRKLELLGLSSYFDIALCSEDSGLVKPALAPFMALASALLLPPENILYVGNKREYDIKGARKAGMASALVSRIAVRPGAARPDFTLPDFTFFDWRDLVAWVDARRR